MTLGDPDDGGGRDIVDDEGTLLKPLVHRLGQGATSEKSWKDD